MDSLTKNQKYVAMALTDDWTSGKDILKQATSDGASGTKNYGLDDDEPLQRMQWSKLVELGVAEMHLTNIALRRGPCWNDFKDRYGNEVTGDGSGLIDVKTELDQLWAIRTDEN
jgi:hypothetical protein